MKKMYAVLLFAVLMLSGAPAGAFIRFTENEFMTAESLDPGMTQTGVHFSVGERYTSYYPEIRYGLGALTEVGVKVGVTSGRFEFLTDKLGPSVTDYYVYGKATEDRLGALVGIDLKYQLIKETEGVPLDMAIDLGIDNTIMDWKNATEVSFSTLVSKNIALTDRGYKFIPYGGFDMAVLAGSAVNEKKTSFYVFAGTEWKLTQKFMFILEVKGGSSSVGGLGIRFEY